jgi:hypothetical protein
MGIPANFTRRMEIRMPYKDATRAAEQAKVYRAANREKIKERKRVHYLANRKTILDRVAAYRAAHLVEIRVADIARYVTVKGDKRRRECLWRRQGIIGMTMEKYNRLCDLQDHVCAICKDGNVCSGKARALEADHCHKTGLVRGLVCITCNRNLGKIDKHGLTGPHRCGTAFASKAFVYLLSATLQNGCPQYQPTI